MSRYMTITDIKRANKDAGRFWFSKDTVRFFKSKIESTVFDGGISPDYPQGCRLWIESTNTYEDKGDREYKIVRFNLASYDIMYVSDEDYRTFVYDNKTDAASKLAAILHEAMNQHRPTEIVEDWHGKVTSE